MSDTRLADILDALADQLAAVPTLAAAVTAGTLAILDGPPRTDFSAASMLVVGGMPEIDNDPQTTSTWDWSAMGVSGQYADIDEAINVPLAVTTLDGSGNIRACRRVAIGLYATAAAFIRGSTLGIDVVMWCLPGPANLTQRQTADGAEVLLTFNALIRTRI